MPRSPLFTGLVAFAALTVAPSLALAEDDCPAGSVHKSQEGFTWCEPTVCQNDGQCAPSEVCRPVGLCVQVGKLTADAATLGEAGQRLVATQRCAPDKTCPDTTVCSDMSRCVSKVDADKMGLLAAPTSSAAPTSAGEAKKSCGCHVPGAGGRTAGALAAAALALVIARGRRRARRRP